MMSFKKLATTFALVAAATLFVVESTGCTRSKQCSAAYDKGPGGDHYRQPGGNRN